MYVVSVANISAERTCTPLMEQFSAAPIPMYLDSSEGLDVYSGMVAYRTGADTVALMDGGNSTQRPFGLFALDHNAIIDDLWGLTNTTTPLAVWVGGPDALFQVSAPAFDTTQAYTIPTNGSRQYLYAGTSTVKGCVTSAAGSSKAIGILFEVPSSTQIVVQLTPATGADS